MIRVLITEDSRTVGETIKLVLSKDPEIEVVGWAKNGQESIDLVKKLKPDVVTMDINMPIMDGLEATRYLMENHPVSILIVSSLVEGNLDVSFNAIKLGALDVLEKPALMDLNSKENKAAEFVRRVKIVSRVRPMRKLSNRHHGKTVQKISPSTKIDQQAQQQLPPSPQHFSSNTKATPSKLLAIGASTGGPAVLNQFLSLLPANFPTPILITQHIIKGFLKGLIQWLQKECALKIHLAENGKTILPGNIYFAPDDVHLGINQDKKIELIQLPPIGGHLPSVDFFMKSVARIYTKNCFGVILTGMGRDGASGLLNIRKVGGKTIVQDKASCAIFGMPKVALEIGAADNSATVPAIVKKVLQWANHG